MKIFFALGSIALALVAVFTGKFLKRTSVLKTPPVHTSESLQRLAVKDGGGQWVGYMEGLVYFNSPQTGSTLVVKDSEITADRVRRRIEESDATFNVHRSA